MPCDAFEDCVPLNHDNSCHPLSGIQVNRLERMTNLQALLRTRESCTARELAHELGVSERTVLRDLSTLREQGVPVEAQSGPGGGLRLDPNRSVVAVRFALDEVIALWLAAKLSVSDASSPWGSAAVRALRKVQASLPKERARTLREVVSRIVIGRPASPRIYAELGKPSRDLFPAIERCFAEGRGLGFDYIDRHGTPSSRVVEPHGLFVEAPAWYLLCRDVKQSTVRLFRIDRMRRAQVLPEHRFTPDLDAAVREWKR